MKTLVAYFFVALYIDAKRCGMLGWLDHISRESRPFQYKWVDQGLR